MTSTATGAATGRRRVQLAAGAGMTGAVLFVVVFTVEGWLRPGYHPLSTFVSELSLGPWGWVQVLSLVVAGVLVQVVGAALAASASAPAVCSVFSRRFRSDPAWRPLAGWTLGLVQRVVLVTFLAWLFGVAARVHRQAAA